MMLNYLGKRKKYVCALVIFIALLALFRSQFVVLFFDSKHFPLLQVEGLYKDRNFRDIGQSINACLGADMMREDLVFRANAWFSGWSCQSMNNPDRIFSLNYDPDEDTVSYCWDADKQQPLIGQVHNTAIKLHDLEFTKSWEDPQMKAASCQFFTHIFAAIRAEQRTLLHCDAGRDRTGLYSAVIAAIAAERLGRTDEQILSAIECDYRKSASLVPEKYGRMERFVREAWQKQGSVGGFLHEMCGIPFSDIHHAADALLNPLAPAHLKK